MTDLSKIRNFSIVAHIDHGKSTLADRLLEECDAIDRREMEDQILDSMDLEQERGITIKARAVRLRYAADDGETYDLNLIDTPGHVDFNYEVSRSLAACEGALLVVDASQGVEAQTLANTYLAIDAGLEVLPVINKIDLPAARPAEVKAEIEDIIGVPAEDAPEISAKNGINIHAVLGGLSPTFPLPRGPVRAASGPDFRQPIRRIPGRHRLSPGEGGHHPARHGCEDDGHRCGVQGGGGGGDAPLGLRPTEEAGGRRRWDISPPPLRQFPTPGWATPSPEPVNRPGRPCPAIGRCNPMVFSGVYPADGSKYQDLREALEKLKLNDASMTYEPESSIALGFGFRCGFLGLLHMEVVQERLEREFNMDLVTTAPSVVYRITKTDGSVIMVDNPLNYPDPAELSWRRSPM